MGGKVLIDVSNPLDYSHGAPPTLTVCNTDSIGEQLQREFPGVRVVKALNTVHCKVMVDPGQLGGEHDLLLCGDDAGARAAVAAHLREWFGWRSVIDLGEIRAARGMEMWLPLWLTLMRRQGTPLFNLHIQR
jgi:predicted dinucleotide-binding enzyme